MNSYSPEKSITISKGQGADVQYPLSNPPSTNLETNVLKR